MERDEITQGERKKQTGEQIKGQEEKRTRTETIYNKREQEGLRKLKLKPVDFVSCK